MQDAPELIWAFYAPHIAEDEGGATIVAHDGCRHGAAPYTRTDLCITEAECQRRIDAAVQAERDAWEHAALRGDDMVEFATIRSGEADLASLLDKP